MTILLCTLKDRVGVGRMFGASVRLFVCPDHNSKQMISKYSNLAYKGMILGYPRSDTCFCDWKVKGQGHGVKSVFSQ